MPIGYSVFLLADERPAPDGSSLVDRLARGLPVDRNVASMYAAAVPVMIWGGVPLAVAQYYEAVLTRIGLRVAVAPDGSDLSASTPRWAAPPAAATFEAPAPPGQPAARLPAIVPSEVPPPLDPAVGNEHDMSEFLILTNELTAVGYEPPESQDEARERCPRCDFMQPEGRDSCAQCGVIFAKFRNRRG